MDFFDDEATDVREANGPRPPPVRHRPTAGAPASSASSSWRSSSSDRVRDAFWARSCQHSARSAVPNLLRRRLHGHRRLRHRWASRLNKFIAESHQAPAAAAHRQARQWASAPSRRDRRARRPARGARDARRRTAAVRHRHEGSRSGFSLLRAAILAPRSARRTSSVSKIIPRRLLQRAGRLLHEPRVACSRGRPWRRRRHRTSRCPRRPTTSPANAFDRSRGHRRCSRVGSPPSSPASTASRSRGVTPPATAPAVRLVKGDAANVPASADLAFRVTVQNQGSVAENDVPVKVTLVLPEQVHAQADRLHRHHRRRPDTGRDHHRVRHPNGRAEQGAHPQSQGRAGQGERVQSNNSGEFKFLLQLK